MTVVRSVLLWALIGAFVGTWAGGMVARAFLPWFNTPGAGIRSQCDCEPLAINTVGHTLSLELGGMLTGTVIFPILALVFGAGRRKKIEPAPPPPAPA